MKVLPLVATALSLSAALFASTAAIVQDAKPLNAPVHNIVLVHGAWVDGSGWRPVYDRLTKDVYHVTIVQEPLTSLDDDVAAIKRVLDQQNGPTILVAHSYGGSVITEAGVHPNVVGPVYVAAHAPAVGEDESDLGLWHRRPAQIKTPAPADALSPLAATY
ncbi:alpha/beta hydrolase [Paraburkholderia sp. FT54]|uniref:alpha/beta fold hydrolase n=1 Tax=Paraburkholderia sp. FT54 TaxID=3074437 RepID=UPI002877A9C0|nr:alpha/beta hydrolase [Paraburkholderia sp. FT54]WNC93811.1 alpha/beta hydrolase [Paraburkholderia sp. FT54]